MTRFIVAGTLSTLRGRSRRRESASNLVRTISQYHVFITVFHGDHVPPHTHTPRVEHKAAIGIPSLRVLEGRFPLRALGLVIEPASQQEDELHEDWQLAQCHHPPEGRTLGFMEALMIHDVVPPVCKGGYKIDVSFDNGKSGVVDFSPYVEREGIFERPRDLDFFRNPQVNRELGVLTLNGQIHVVPGTPCGEATASSSPSLDGFVSWQSDHP